MTDLLGERHRALPDADLVWQWWRQLINEFDEAAIAHAIDGLLAGPVLPSMLAPALIDALPSAPGAFVMHAEAGRALAIGAALGVIVGVGFGWAIVTALADDGITTLAIPARTLALVVGVAWMAGIAASLRPGQRAARLDILRAIASH